MQRRNCEKSFPIAQVTVLAKVRNTFWPYPHESGQAKTGFNRLHDFAKNTLESGSKKVFLRKIKSLVGSFTHTPLDLRNLNVSLSFLVCYRKIHYLTREFHVKLHLKTHIALIAISVFKCNFITWNSRVR